MKFRASMRGCGATPSSGRFSIVDQSRNGTWVNGRRLTRGTEMELPDRAEIGIAEVVKLNFEAKR